MIWESRDEDVVYCFVTSVLTRRIWDPKLLWAETGNGVRPLAVIRDLHNLVIKSTNHIEDDLRRARELSATATASVRLLNGVIRSCGSKPLSRQEQGAFLFLTTIDPELARYTPFGIPEDILQCIKRLTEGNSAEKILP